MCLKPVSGLGDDKETDRVIFRSNAASASAVASRHRLTLTRPPDAHGFAVGKKSDQRTTDDVVKAIKADPEVSGAEPDRNVRIPETTSGAALNQSTAAILDTLGGRTLTTFFGVSVWASYVRQPAAALVKLSETHRYLTSGTGIVAVIDTGVDPNHPVLKSALVPGYDFVRGIAGIPSELSDLDQSTAAILDQSTAAILDKNTAVQVNQSTAAILDQSTAAILDTTQLPPAFGHGTLVAGIIHLVAPTAKIMPLKAFAGDGSGTVADIVRAIYFAVDNGANVINMSFSLTDPSLELMRALSYATAHNVVCVASVGNGGAETLLYPAAFHNVLAVASTNKLDKRSSFSNFGPALASVAAPGEEIVTVYPGGAYALVSGTSFAAPFVSGGVALMRGVNESLDPLTASQAFFLSARKMTTEVGYGRVDVYRAVRSARPWEEDD
jgi:subtilisin family serine protease